MHALNPPSTSVNYNKLQRGCPNQQWQLLTSPAVAAAGRVADVILAANNGPILQLSAQCDHLLGTYCWQDSGAVGDTRHTADDGVG